ncbi:MAG: copper-binding protein [Nitrosopumilus sp.]|nr:copper-binding protein [Nitrosopumilus sp.]
MKTMFLLILLVPMMLTPAFSQSIITFDVDTTNFAPGEIIELKGTVDAGLEGQPIAVEIKDADGNVILIRTVTSDDKGKFTLKFKVPSIAKAGEFDIVTNVEIDGQSFSVPRPVGITETKSLESTEPPPIKSTEPKPLLEPVCGTGTILKDGQCVPKEKSTVQEKSSKGGGCLIATATYGSELSPQVQQLRELRDNILLQTESGTSFMNTFNDVYYSFSPVIADYERENPVFKGIVKIAITPMISSLSILNHVEMNSDQEVLGYGISLILLNVGMYFVAPAIVIVEIRKKF